MERIFLQLLHMSLTAAVLVLAVVLLRLAFCKAPRWLHCLLWVMVAVRLVCPFTIESNWSLMPSVPAVMELDRPGSSTPVIVPDVPSTEVVVPDAPSVSLPTGGISSSPVTPTLPDSSFAAPGDSVDPWQVALTIAAYVWLLGMLAMAGYAMFSTLRLRHRVREAACLVDNIWQCDHIRTPFILGVFHPRIYLPSDLEGSARDSVVAHEKAHLRRLDHFWKPLGFLLLTVYWFNPALWVAYILLCRDIEAACDERVVRGMSAAERRVYSEALLACSAPRRLISACPLAFGETSVKSRIKSVLSYKKPTVWILVAALLVSTVAGVCLLTDRPTAAPESDEPPLVSDGTDRPTGNGSIVSTGEPLYDTLLKAMVDARQERPDCSTMVWQLAEWSDLGIRLLDVDQNGQKELLLSAVQWGEGVTPFVYDVYTIKDDKLVHLLSSVERGRYYLREDGYVEYQWAGGASVSGTDFYRLVNGSLTFVERITYDDDYAVEIGLADSLASITEGFWFRTTHIPDGSKEGYVSITPQQAKDSIAAITSAHPLLNVNFLQLESGGSGGSTEEPIKAYWQTFSHPMTYGEASKLTGGYALHQESIEVLQQILDEVTWSYGPLEDAEFVSRSYFCLNGETRYFVYLDTVVNYSFLYKENAPDDCAYARLTDEQSDILEGFVVGGVTVKGTHTLSGYFAEWNKEAQFYELDVVQADDTSLIGKRIWVSTSNLLGRGIPYIGALLEVSYDGTVHSSYTDMVYAIDYDVLDADKVINVTIPESDIVNGKVIYVVDGAALMYCDDLEPYDTVLWVNYESAHPDLKPQIGETYQVSYDGLIKTTYPVQLVAKTMTKIDSPPVSSDFISEAEAIELAAKYWNIQPGSIDSETSYAAVIYVLVAPTEEVQQYVMGLRYVDALYGGPANSAIFCGIHIDAKTGKIWDLPID